MKQSPRSPPGSGSDVSLILGNPRWAGRTKAVPKRFRRFISFYSPTPNTTDWLEFQSGANANA